MTKVTKVTKVTKATKVAKVAKAAKVEKVPVEVCADHALSFPRYVTAEVDLQAVFRDAVRRLKGIFTDRILGVGQAELTESDRRLLSGELEILVPPGHTVNLVAQPQVVFRPEKLVLDDESADHFQVGDVKVGRNSQLLSSAPVPGTLFKAASTPWMLMDTAQISMYVTVTLTNTSGAPRPVPKVVMLGKIVA
jgi:hypothetical protein